MNRGFRKIDNQIFEALIIANLTRSGYKIILAIINKTWGWQKQKGAISLTEFAKVTGLSRQGVINAIRKLEVQHLIHVERNGLKRGIYSIRHYEEWQTGEAHTPHSLVTSALLENAQNFTINSQVLTSGGHLLKKKHTLKERDTPPDDLLLERPSTPPKKLVEEKGKW